MKKKFYNIEQWEKNYGDTVFAKWRIDVHNIINCDLRQFFSNQSFESVHMFAKRLIGIKISGEKIYYVVIHGEADNAPPEMKHKFKENRLSFRKHFTNVFN
jgi:uncharacterized protein YqgQ